MQRPSERVIRLLPRYTGNFPSKIRVGQYVRYRISSVVLPVRWVGLTVWRWGLDRAHRGQLGVIGFD